MSKDTKVNPAAKAPAKAPAAKAKTDKTPAKITEKKFVFKDKSGRFKSNFVEQKIFGHKPDVGSLWQSHEYETKNGEKPINFDDVKTDVMVVGKKRQNFKKEDLPEGYILGDENGTFALRKDAKTGEKFYLKKLTDTDGKITLVRNKVSSDGGASIRIEQLAPDQTKNDAPKNRGRIAEFLNKLKAKFRTDLKQTTFTKAEDCYKKDGKFHSVNDDLATDKTASYTQITDAFGKDKDSGREALPEFVNSLLDDGYEIKNRKDRYGKHVIPTPVIGDGTEHYKKTMEDGSTLCYKLFAKKESDKEPSKNPGSLVIVQTRYTKDGQAIRRIFKNPEDILEDAEAPKPVEAPDPTDSDGYDPEDITYEPVAA
ncbi:MAG: hypothetical protein PHC64_04365 [Candidatus Gastranaerophilales bacterium]|nr:hypothetical protein [Candidatus Gastranaerophilales bacterium]